MRFKVGLGFQADVEFFPHGLAHIIRQILHVLRAGVVFVYQHKGLLLVHRRAANLFAF